MGNFAKVSGYDSEENRQHLEEHRLLDGIMRKAHRKHPLSEAQTKRNRYLSKTHYVIEQSFGTLHRKFRYARAAYFGLLKVSVQSHLKAMCLNLLKAANRLRPLQNSFSPTAENLYLGFGCWGKGILQRSQATNNSYTYCPLNTKKLT